MLYSPDLLDDYKTLTTMRVPLSMTEPELRKLLKRIYDTSPSERAKQLAGPMVELIKETFDGIFKGADQATEWLTIPQYADMVSGGAFQPCRIIDGKTDIFVAIPLDVLDATPALGRCIIGALLYAVYQADGAIAGPVQFFIDEARRFGHMRAFKLARDALRKCGVKMVLYYQHINQLREQWGGQGALDEWLGAMAWVAFAGISDYDTAELVSKSIGNMPVLAWSESDNTGTQLRWTRSRSWGRSYSERARRVKLPEELMYDLRTDALIVLVKGHRPVICGMPLYYRRPEFSSRVPQDRFVVRPGGVPLPTT